MLNSFLLYLPISLFHLFTRLVRSVSLFPWLWCNLQNRGCVLVVFPHQERGIFFFFLIVKTRHAHADTCRNLESESSSWAMFY